ncbi:hypothetical protein FNH06_31675 [Amycolatopsis acidiphila]|uniref:Uncharacterized protein n=2 Tax=Amycolatopsis acidiphila TaxID=715473 RepID=A0A557ZZH0_9PSEU|nr:hypothetical protein FNH06_31675 [Amycolatopsis acidiphila]
MLAGAFWTHLHEHPLPEPCTVTLNPAVPEVEVQVSPGTAVSHLAELLVWAYTLDQVTATWWHTDHGTLHITIWGRVAGGARFRVYGGITFADCTGLVPLEVGESEGVSVDELYALRDLLGEGVAA